MKTTRRPAKKAHEFSAEQQFYFYAKTAHETAYAAYRAECAETGAVVTDATSEEDCEKIWARDEDIRAKYEIDALSAQLSDAERRLINWSIDHALRLAPEQRATLELVREKKAVSPKVWERLVDIASRLAA